MFTGTFLSGCYDDSYIKNNLTITEIGSVNLKQYAKSKTKILVL